MILLDTCALIWWTLDPDRLTIKATNTINKAAQESEIIVPAISLWEIAVKCKKNKLDLGLGVDEFLENLKLAAAVRIMPTDARTWLMAVELEWQHKDHVDRVIVSHAIINNMPLVTADRSIIEYYNKSIWE